MNIKKIAMAIVAAAALTVPGLTTGRAVPPAGRGHVRAGGADICGDCINRAIEAADRWVADCHGSPQVCDALWHLYACEALSQWCPACADYAPYVCNHH